jgi:hypothetical protein
MNSNFDNDTRAGTIGGTLLVILLHAAAGEVLRTAAFAALGATVSFFISLGWKFLLRFFHSRRHKSSKNQ